MEDVTSLLNKNRCYCLNEESPQQFQNLFCGDHTLRLKSDGDDQLLLHLEFGQTLSLKQIQIGVPGDNSCPKTVKLFLNKQDLDFSSAGDTPVTQEITLSPASTTTGELITIPLSAAKWQRVDSVTFFVEDNHGNETSSLYAIKLFGKTLFQTDVSQIHNQPPLH